MAVAVSVLKYETVEGGAEVSLTVSRFPNGAWFSCLADAQDLPADIADGLRDWLANAPTNKEKADG